MRLSVFFPAYYDEGNIGLVARAARDVLDSLSLEDYEITIIEDGSPDNTAAVVDQLAREIPRVRAVHHKYNMGYGATLKEGFLSARFEYVFYTDGDNQFDMQELPQLLAKLPAADIVVGYRRQKQYSPFRLLTSGVYNALLRRLFALKIRDVNCAFKLVPRRLFQEITLESNAGFIDAEVLIKGRDLGYSIAEIPVTHRPRLEGLATGARPVIVLNTIRETLRYWWQWRRAKRTARPESK